MNKGTQKFVTILLLFVLVLAGCKDFFHPDGPDDPVRLPDNLSLAASLEWVTNNAVEGGAYVITLRDNERIAPAALSYGGKNVRVTLGGGTTEKAISLNAAGSLFTVQSGVTLTLGNNVTLQGRADNTASLVSVSGGGTLIMNNGSKIKGNTANSSEYSANGGGVYIGGGGIFTMAGGEISENTTSYASASYSAYSCGGGVYVGGGGTFTIAGGKISGNTASSSSFSSYGGGVYVYSGGTFKMAEGKISGNIASATASSSHGGGVYVDGSSTSFTMAGGEISGNTASSSVSSSGGGVFVTGSFAKIGGVIYGSNTSDTLKNTAFSDSYGHAVYISGGKKRNTTAGTGVNLDSSTADNWE